jgi:hypothetical protein
VSEKSFSNFGILVAYVLPGFIAVAGLAPIFPTLAQWLRPTGQGDLGLGPPVYALLGATAIGLILSCFRWVLIDHIHQWTGVTPPVWDDIQLPTRLGGFDYLVQNHFRYYEFTANTLLAVLGAYSMNRVLGTLPFLGLGTDLAVLILCIVLFAASRDALAKYYNRTGRLIGPIAEKELRGTSMFNGNDHSSGGKPGPNPKPETKPQEEAGKSGKPKQGEVKTPAQK